MSATSNKRNVKIEIIRLIACMMVVWYHIRELPWKTNGELSETAVFFEAICTICVMTFFLITGFFIYNNKGSIFENWISLIKKFIFQVFIPFLIVTLFSIIFHEYLISRHSFLYCITNISISSILKVYFETFSHFSANYLPGTSGHLWYVFSYAIIIFAFPITKFLIIKLPRYVIYILLIILSIFMIINDYCLFFDDSTFDTIFKIIHKPIYYSVFGYVLYNDIIKKYIDEKAKNLDNNVLIINKKLFVFSIIVYIVTFILLFKTQVAYDLGTNGEYVYTSWLSIYSLVLTSSFVLVVYNLNIDRFLNAQINNLIFYISSKTFGIYLLHYLIITKLLSTGIQKQFIYNRPTIFHHFLFYILYSAFIFVVTFNVVYIIEKIYGYLKSLVLKR